MVDPNNIQVSTELYYEALWVLVLFGATALLRVALGELCVERISRSILTTEFINGKTLDAFIGCSNGGRSLGFVAIYRLWRVQGAGTLFSRWWISLPFLTWLVGLPIKLIAVQAVRNGVPYLGLWGTWIVGIVWIAFAGVVKGISLAVSHLGPIRDRDGKRMSYRKLFQERFCKLESHGAMVHPHLYLDGWNRTIPLEETSPLGVLLEWEFIDDPAAASLNSSVASPAIRVLRTRFHRQPPKLSSSENYVSLIEDTISAEPAAADPAIP